MREHLFKAKRPNGEWVEGYYAEEDGKVGILIDTKLFDTCKRLKWIDVLPETVCEFTGLLDKNGKKIFEGDVVTPSAYKNTTSENWKIFKCEVIFYKGMFCLKPNKKYIDGYNPLYKSLDGAIKAGNAYEIIGNIHDGDSQK